MIEDKPRSGIAPLRQDHRTLEERLEDARERRAKVLEAKGGTAEPALRLTKPWVAEGQPADPEDDFDAAEYVARLTSRDPGTGPEVGASAPRWHRTLRVVAWGTAVVALAALGWTASTGDLPDVIAFIGAGN